MPNWAIMIIKTVAKICIPKRYMFLIFSLLVNAVSRHCCRREVSLLDDVHEVILQGFLLYNILIPL